jgi:hypothetical protein
MKSAGMSGSTLNNNVGSGRYPMEGFGTLDRNGPPSRSWRPQRQPSEVELFAIVT